VQWWLESLREREGKQAQERYDTDKTRGTRHAGWSNVLTSKSEMRRTEKWR
jgi:hypothetical protein